MIVMLSFSREAETYKWDPNSCLIAAVKFEYVVSSGVEPVSPFLTVTVPCVSLLPFVPLSLKTNVLDEPAALVKVILSLSAGWPV